MTETATDVRTAHTPGPWVANGEVREVGERNGTKHMLYCADIVLGVDPESGWRGYIASVQSCDHLGNGITREEAEANARLMAAAPDLASILDEAEALAIAVIEFNEGKRDKPIGTPLFAKILQVRATIAASSRSTGEA